MHSKEQNSHHPGITDKFLARCADLKAQLVHYVIENHWGAIELHAERGFDDINMANEFTFSEALEDAIYGTQFSTGEHFLERFVKDHELSAEDANLILGWRDWLLGVFQVTRNEGLVIDTVNLVDGLEYGLVTTQDFAESGHKLRLGEFIVSRIVPVQDVWMVSGCQRFVDKDEAKVAYGISGHLAQASPRFFFRNPANLALARKQVQGQYPCFLERFGLPWIMGTWDVIQDCWREFALSSAVGEFQEPRNQVLSLPAYLREAETIGMICDPDNGVFFLEEFGLFLAALHDPARLKNRLIRKTVFDYLTESDVAPAIFGIVWRHRPAQLNALLGTLLHRPDFDWARMGEDCLREYNPEFLEKPRYPGLVPLSEQQVEGLRYLEDWRGLEDWHVLENWDILEESWMSAETAELLDGEYEFGPVDLTRKGTKATNMTPPKRKRKRKKAKQARRRNRRSG